METVAATKWELLCQMHVLTQKMMGRLEDSEFLLAAIDQRQELMDAYDQAPNNPHENDPERAQKRQDIKNDMLRMNKSITAALQLLREQAKATLASSNNQKRVLSYTNQAIASSGSYMDFKK